MGSAVSGVASDSPTLPLPPLADAAADTAAAAAAAAAAAGELAGLGVVADTAATSVEVSVKTTST